MNALLIAFAAFIGQQSWVITDYSAGPDVSPVAKMNADIGDVTEYVYPIRNADGNGNSEGGCVALGNGTFQTVAHVFYPYVNGNFQKRPTGSTGTCEVQVDGTWRLASYRIIDGSDAGDVALVRINGDAPRSIKVRRAPKYLEKVVVYGLKTGYVQCGIVSGNREISLYENEQGSVSGDSGGGVFSETGEFLGTIQGRSDKEKRVTKFRPNDFPVVYAGQAPAAAPAMNCANGVCTPVQQYAAPQQQSNGHYERGGLFGGKLIWVPN